MVGGEGEEEEEEGAEDVGVDVEGFIVKVDK